MVEFVVFLCWLGLIGIISLFLLAIDRLITWGKRLVTWYEHRRSQLSKHIQNHDF